MKTLRKRKILKVKMKYFVKTLNRKKYPKIIKYAIRQRKEWIKKNYNIE